MTVTEAQLAKRIYRDYGPRLKNFIKQKVSPPQEAEEIFQETIIAALDAYSLFSHRSSFFTWLCAIARHEIIDYYRRKKIKTVLFSHFPWLENLASEALGPEQQVLQKEAEIKIKATLQDLNEGYSEVLRLKYYQGLSMAQIAKRLNETVKAVESRLFRARQAFAKAFLADFS